MDSSYVGPLPGVWPPLDEGRQEYACRAGSLGRWSFGDDESQLGNYAWYEATASSQGLWYAQPVATKRANPWGLYDMHGNVYEWVNDWMGPYGSRAQADPPGPARGSKRVSRGGGFDLSAQNTRSAMRNAFRPDYRDAGIGARLLRTQ